MIEAAFCIYGKAKPQIKLARDTDLSTFTTGCAHYGQLILADTF